MKLNANRSDTEPDRIARLHRVAKELELTGVSKKVNEIHDIKGTLYIDWNVRPKSVEVFTVIKAWADESEVVRFV